MKEPTFSNPAFEVLLNTTLAFSSIPLTTISKTCVNYFVGAEPFDLFARECILLKGSRSSLHVDFLQTNFWMGLCHGRRLSFGFQRTSKGPMNIPQPATVIPEPQVHPATKEFIVS
eukprot:3840273-Amphidinium_carterae.1